MLGQEALSRMGGWKRAMASGDQRCRNEGRSYEAKYCLLAFVLLHLPYFFFVIPASFFFPVLLLEPLYLLEGPRKPSYRPPLPHHSHSQPFLKLLLLCQDSAGGKWRAEEGGMATNSTVPWQLLAKGRKKYKGTPNGCVRLQLGAGERLRGALCHVAAWVGMA